MKKKITLLAIVAVVMTTGIFANTIETDVNNQVKSSFSSKFTGAKDVTWNKAEQYIKASFTKDDQAMSAYFGMNGELIGVSRNILSQQLPMGINMELKQLLANSWITELLEFTNGEETTYFTVIENADQKTYMKSVGSNQWSLYRKNKKN